jgi:hypothetical protein
MENPDKWFITAGGRIRCLRCTAMSKSSRLQCAKPALKVSRTQKCGFHGGKSTGPKTAEGKARIGVAHLKHGNDTNKNRQERSESSLRMAQLEDVMHALGMTTATRTTGRKPTGYWPIKTLEAAKQWCVEDAVRLVKGLPDEG